MSILIGLKRRRRRRKIGYTVLCFFKVFFQKKLCNHHSLVWTQNFVTVGFISLSIYIFVRVSNLSMSMPCHAMMPCHFATSMPQTNQGILKCCWEKSFFLSSFVAICTHLFPQCNQVVFVNQPGRNHEMYFLFCWQQIDSFLRKLSWSRRRSLTTSPALYCPLSVCNQYISIARIMNCLSFTWIAERIFVGFSNRLTLS